MKTSRTLFAYCLFLSLVLVWTMRAQYLKDTQKIEAMSPAAYVVEFKQRTSLINSK